MIENALKIKRQNYHSLWATEPLIRLNGIQDNIENINGVTAHRDSPGILGLSLDRNGKFDFTPMYLCVDSCVGVCLFFNSNKYCYTQLHFIILN